jgi:hypothetical protein
VAGRMLEGAYQKGQASKAEFKRDLDQGISRARAEAQAKKDELDAESDTRVRPAGVPIGDTSVGRNDTGP